MIQQTSHSLDDARRVYNLHWFNHIVSHFLSYEWRDFLVSEWGVLQYKTVCVKTTCFKWFLLII